MRLPGDKDLRVPAWFNGVFSVVFVMVLWGLLKAIWNHDHGDIIGASLMLLIFGILWGGTLVSAMED